MSYLILCKIERFMIYSYDLSAELIDRLNLIIWLLFKFEFDQNSSWWSATKQQSLQE